MTSSTNKNNTVRVAAAHVSSEFFDPEAGVRKAIKYLTEAAKAGVDLIVFPESFIPGFPIWNALSSPIKGHENFVKFAASSLRVDGPEIKAIASAAAQQKISVSLGFSEVASYSAGCLWNSMVLINAQGIIVNHHRKLVPTFYEKLTWSRGDGAGLTVVDMPFGRVGGLICGENGNPLSRYALMAQGEEIHCANYPPIWPFKDPRNSEPYDLADAIRVRAAAHCFEAKVFSIVSAGFITDENIALLCDDDEARAILEGSPRSASMIVTPSGTTLGETLSDREGLVIADIDVSSLVELKQHHDMAGYYNRHDVFNVSVNRSRQKPLHDIVINSASNSVSDVNTTLEESLELINYT
ncbi:carbon-nitrogen hydrolase family protein [Psychromonas sp. 14N.309.X.WAT.B.A12]|uniref:carbon-nitrogen hydrolase family protein n=1 Tax=unclassified Psychromonas TaxID=2614957 RepID=UPI0025B15A27|nr:carbon-nitrogen hydrolase family protein [Psychromonas sp. 14N.309.X.WAT.B.A12]MDN2663827.1 carbon-nitrogen hydrolase family protein [Psychromonas sp. 14N.309.X.WAT.B.A12]